MSDEPTRRELVRELVSKGATNIDGSKVRKNRYPYALFFLSHGVCTWVGQLTVDIYRFHPSEDDVKYPGYLWKDWVFICSIPIRKMCIHSTTPLCIEIKASGYNWTRSELIPSAPTGHLYFPQIDLDKTSDP